MPLLKVKAIQTLVPESLKPLPVLSVHVSYLFWYLVFLLKGVGALPTAR